MNFKSNIFLLGILLSACSSFSQNSPVKFFTLKQEPTTIPADSAGVTNLYAVSFEAKKSFEITSVNFKIKGSLTDSVISQQNFILPQSDGVYEVNGVSNALIKDHNNLFIILGNVKSTGPLKVVADFTDSQQILYPGILTNQ